MSFSAQVSGRKISAEPFNEKIAYIVSNYSSVWVVREPLAFLAAYTLS